MADRFPSLEDFSEGQIETTDKYTAPDTEDFLARERAALGDDADLFATPNDHTGSSETVKDVNDDLLEGGDYIQTQDLSQETYGFESSFPALETQNQQVGPGGTITSLPSTSYTNYREPEEEPEIIQEWRARRDADLARRAESSAEKKAATIKKAQEDIDDFYVSYGNRADKARAQTRTEAEQFFTSREDTSVGGTSWERIAKLVDISGKGYQGGASGSGKERFRELLLSLKKDPNAPVASGF